MAHKQVHLVPWRGEQNEKEWLSMRHDTSCLDLATWKGTNLLLHETHCIRRAPDTTLSCT
jgi:hypothetical protein